MKTRRNFLAALFGGIVAAPVVAKAVVEGQSGHGPVDFSAHIQEMVSAGASSWDYSYKPNMPESTSIWFRQYQVGDNRYLVLYDSPNETYYKTIPADNKDGFVWQKFVPKNEAEKFSFYEPVG